MEKRYESAFLEAPLVRKRTASLKSKYLQKTFNPIPTGHGRNQPIYERHVTKSGRNRVKKWVKSMQTAGYNGAYMVCIQFVLKAHVKKDFDAPFRNKYDRLPWSDWFRNYFA